MYNQRNAVLSATFHAAGHSAFDVTTIGLYTEGLLELLLTVIQ